MNYLIPRGDYFFTPILIYANVGIWLLMVLGGVNWIAPNGESMVSWGANFPALTLSTQPWRLLTCTFLHFGVVHLAMNMLALFQIGAWLERIIGRWRFLTLYLFTGVIASVVSIWWNGSNMIGAGASGSVFGIIGVFTALLTTKLLHKGFRQEFLSSMLLFIGYNIIFGLRGGVDNAAHLGGLFSGAVLGFINYLDLRALREQKPLGNRFFILSAIACLLVVLGGFFFLRQTQALEQVQVSTTQAELAQLRNEFMKQEELGILALEGNPSESDIQAAAIQPFENCLKLTQQMQALPLDEKDKYIAEELERYSLLRLKAARALHRYLKTDLVLFRDSSGIYQEEADSLITKMNRYFESIYK